MTAPAMKPTEPAWLILPAAGLYASMTASGRMMFARIMLECGKAILEGRGFTDEQIFTDIQLLYDKGLVHFFVENDRMCMAACDPSAAPQLRPDNRNRAGRRRPMRSVR